jgi:hypothetical protein
MSAAAPSGYRWFVAAILLAAFGLRAWDLQGQSLFCDETMEASIATLPIDQIVNFSDGFPPLYHLLLAGWLQVFPAPESARWLSVILGTLTAYGLFRWTEQSVGPLAALFAAALLAISPLHVFFSQEMRAYVLYLCLATFTLRYFFAALATDSFKSWWCFVLFASLGINTHYYGGILVALLGLVLLYYRLDWGRIKRGVGYFSAIAVFSAPALVLLSSDLSYQSDGFAGRTPLAASLAHTAYSFFCGFSLGPSLGELHSLPKREIAAQAWPWIALVAPAASWLLWLGWRELRTKPYGDGIVWLALASAPLIGIAGELAGVSGKVRYWSWALMPLLVWLAAGAARGWNGRSSLATRGALGVLVAVQALALFNRYDNPRYANEDMRSVAAYLKRHSQPTVPVACVADYLAPTLRMYLNGPETLARRTRLVDDTQPIGQQGSQWTVLPRTEQEARGSTPFDDEAIGAWLSDLQTHARPDGEFWLVYAREYHGDPGGLLLEELQRRGLIVRERDFAGAVLYRGHAHLEGESGAMSSSNRGVVTRSMASFARN